jgi:hypothetical protein
MKKILQKIKYRIILTRNEQNAIKIGYAALEAYSTKRSFRRTQFGQLMSKIIMSNNK